MSKQKTFERAVQEMTANYKKEPLFHARHGQKMPNRNAIIEILQELQQVIFPGYFGPDSVLEIDQSHYLGCHLNHLYDHLAEQTATAFLYYSEVITMETEREAMAHAQDVCETLFGELPVIQDMLMKDVQAGFDGDPAAKSKEEIIYSYPGLFAIYVYRVAHVFYKMEVPFIPRIMSEYAHGLTGIDINPGAEIGEYFFIDHGTGVVIGETTVIGSNVKLYQGVTLGALSTRDGQQLSGVKRHPTIENNVTVYSNSTVLGGQTVIGENTIIGGNTFITESIPANTKVSAKSPELLIKHPKKHTWDWEN